MTPKKQNYSDFVRFLYEKITAQDSVIQLNNPSFFKEVKFASSISIKSKLKEILQKKYDRPITHVNGNELLDNNRDTINKDYINIYLKTQNSTTMISEDGTVYDMSIEGKTKYIPCAISIYGSNSDNYFEYSNLIIPKPQDIVNVRITMGKLDGENIIDIKQYSLYGTYNEAYSLTYNFIKSGEEFDRKNEEVKRKIEKQKMDEFYQKAQETVSSIKKE